MENIEVSVSNKVTIAQKQNLPKKVKVAETDDVFKSTVSSLNINDNSFVITDVHVNKKYWYFSFWTSYRILHSKWDYNLGQNKKKLSGNPGDKNNLHPGGHEFTFLISLIEFFK